MEQVKKDLTSEIQRIMMIPGAPQEIFEGLSGLSPGGRGMPMKGMIDK
jgi:hypothetical protein